MSAASSRRTVYTVAQVNSYVHQMFQEDPFLNRIYVRGEVSNCKYHSSGHIYFSLKDEKAQIFCVLFAGKRDGLRFRLQDGQKVIVFGSLGVYEKSGSYQLYVSAVRLDGIGALYERYEALKQELSDIGMFDAMYKKPIPRYIRTLGVVTAPAGAAVRDIINVSKRRNPGIRILLYPALVQGEGAAESIVKGIRLLDRSGVDTIIVGRGGGSIEELWAFNERIVAEAIFNAGTPIISAVGHETDFTIADYVADLRAPTPSAAAELAVDDMVLTQDSLQKLRKSLNAKMLQKTDYSRKKLEAAGFRLQAHGPKARLRERMLELDHIQDRMSGAVQSRIRYAEERTRAAASRLDLSGKILSLRGRMMSLSPRLKLGMKQKLEDSRRRQEVLQAQISAMSPQRHLDHGYVYLEDEERRPVRSVRQVTKGQIVSVTLKDGKLDAEVRKVNADPRNSEGI